MSTIAPSEPSDLASLEAARAKWLRTVEVELKGASFEKKLLTRTFEGVTLQPLYTRADAAGRSPGDAALARYSGYADAGWEVAQEIAAATVADFNARLREDLMHGQNAAVVPEAFAGAPAEALAGVELAVIPVHVNAGADASAAGAALLALAAKNGETGFALRGSVTADPLGCQARDGGLPAEYPVLLDALAAWTKRAAKEAPALRTIGVNAALWAEAGGTAAQELAGALASVAEYLRALAARGVAAETSVPRLKVSFSSGPQFLVETAKFRAWRPLLARVVAAFGADPALAAKASVHAATARWNLTRLDPHVNMLRVTTEALSAVLGGVDALHISPFDGVGGAGTGEAFPRRIARNVHALLAEEFGFAAPADPAGGSWCVERLTDELARKAWEIFQGIEAEGGLPAALRSGAPQKMLAAAATEKARAVGSRKLGLIGTNLFPNLRETPLAPAPEVVSAAKPAATCERVTPFAAFRVAAGFEALRDASKAFAERTGAKPRVFLAKMGPVAQHKARADFAAGFFAPGGFEPVAKESFATAAEAAAAIAASSAQVAVLCSTDDTYPELVPAFAAAVRAARPDVTLVLAGLPAEESVRAQFAAAGIDVFIHLRASVEETLAQLLKKIGAL